MDEDLRLLLEARAARVRPGLDDKALTGWNALMIRGLALAAQALEEPDWLRMAGEAFDFLRAKLWDGQRLRASFSRGEAYFNAYLDDYAFTLEAALLLLQQRWSVADLEFAEQLATVIAEQFADADGGLFFTAHDHERLLVRPRLLADDVTPSGGAVACEALAELGHLLGRGDWVELAERSLRRASGAVVRQPVEHARFMEARHAVERPGLQVVLRGSGPALEAWQAAARRSAMRLSCYAIPAEAAGLPEALASKPADGEAIAYVCTGPTCEEPFRTLEAFADRMDAA